MQEFIMFTKADFIDHSNWRFELCDGRTAATSPLKGAPDYFNLLFMNRFYSFLIYGIFSLECNIRLVFRWSPSTSCFFCFFFKLLLFFGIGSNSPRQLQCTTHCTIKSPTCQRGLGLERDTIAERHIMGYFLIPEIVVGFGQTVGFGLSLHWFTHNILCRPTLCCIWKRIFKEMLRAS